MIKWTCDNPSTCINHVINQSCSSTCLFCEDKKYTDNLEYLVHLQKAHKCNLPGHAVKKDIKKGKPGKSSKGQGKC